MDFVDDRLRAEFVFTVRARPRQFIYAASAFTAADRFCMAVLCGRAGRLTAENGGHRPGQNPNSKGDCGCGESFNV
jgi:hypothetical protein